MGLTTWTQGKFFLFCFSSVCRPTSHRELCQQRRRPPTNHPLRRYATTPSRSQMRGGGGSSLVSLGVVATSPPPPLACKCEVVPICFAAQQPARRVQGGQARVTRRGNEGDECTAGAQTTRLGHWYVFATVSLFYLLTISFSFRCNLFSTALTR